MFKRKNKSKPALSTSAARADGLGPVERAWCMAALFLLSSCAEFGASVQLLATFETDPIGDPPAPPSNPRPTPPHDRLDWKTPPPPLKTFFTAEIVTGAPAPYTGGRRSVQVKPSPEYTSPDVRQVFLVANTAPFTNSPPTNIRGEVRLRLDDLGTVGIGLRPVRGEAVLEDFIGGIEVSNLLPPSNFAQPSIGEVHGLQAFNGSRLTSDIFPLPHTGPSSDYSSGNVIDIEWSIDQASRTFSASVRGGSSRWTNSFPAMSAGLPTTPIRGLLIYFWMQRPSGTVVTIDDLVATENALPARQ